MNYIDYINYLKSKNIILFDHDYRVSYHNIKNYLVNNELTGGGNRSKMAIENYSQDDLNMLITVSLSSNPQYLLFLAKH